MMKTRIPIQEKTKILEYQQLIGKELDEKIIIKNVDDFNDPSKRIKVEAPTYDDIYNPNKFLNWLVQINEFFNWYKINDYQRVIFIKMKLVGHAKIYWINILAKK